MTLCVWIRQLEKQGVQSCHFLSLIGSVNPGYLGLSIWRNKGTKVITQDSRKGEEFPRVVPDTKKVRKPC